MRGSVNRLIGCVSEKDFRDAVCRCFSVSHVCIVLFKTNNGTAYKAYKSLAAAYMCDTSHFDNRANHRKYSIVTRICRECGSSFTCNSSGKKSRIFCSRDCANKNRGPSYRENLHPNWNGGGQHYSDICFIHHKKECVVCGESNTVDVHHFDGDRTNNDPENLIPLCPTHHAYMHRNLKELIFKKIIDYIDSFKSGLVTQ
jgi:hypothetical protein